MHHGGIKIDFGVCLCFIWISLPVLEKKNKRHYFSSCPRIITECRNKMAAVMPQLSRRTLLRWLHGTVCSRQMLGPNGPAHIQLEGRSQLGQKANPNGGCSTLEWKPKVLSPDSVDLMLRFPKVRGSKWRYTSVSFTHAHQFSSFLPSLGYLHFLAFPIYPFTSIYFYISSPLPSLHFTFSALLSPIISYLVQL